VTYGSPRVDETRVVPAALRAAADGLSVEVILAELNPGFIYEFSTPRLRTQAGEPLANPLGYYTVNRLHNGDTTIGGTTRLPMPGENAVGSREVPGRSLAATVAAGALVYRFYCVGCHQPDGRGVAGGAANFVDDKARLAKSDAELLATIADGSEAKGMPAFGATLSVSQRSAVLAYIRATFGVATASSR
jgi:mono/diheme cytochrome c family protein